MTKIDAGLQGMSTAAYHSGLVFQEQLLQITGYKRKGDLIRHLKSEGIVFNRGAGGRIYTTIEAINKSMEQESITTQVVF